MVTVWVYAWIMLVMGFSLDVLGGLISGLLMRRGCGVTFSLRVPFILGAGLAAVCNLLVSAVSSLPATLVVLSLAMLGYNTIQASYVGFVTGIFPHGSVGRGTPLTGVTANVMTILLMFSAGVVLDHFSYLSVFLAAGVLPLLQIVCAVW